MWRGSEVVLVEGGSQMKTTSPHLSMLAIFRRSVWIFDHFQNSSALRSLWMTPYSVNQNPREASSRSRIYVFSLVNILVCWLVYPALFGHNEKRYRPEIWYKHSPRPYLKTCFFVFSKKWPWGPLASKNCRVSWISAYLLDCLVSINFDFVKSVILLINFTTLFLCQIMN